MKIKTFVEGPIDANNYLIIDEKTNDAVLVDCSSSREEFINGIKEQNVNLKYILLTHGHYDHILGVDKFKEIFNVKTLMHKKDIEQVELAPRMMQYFSGMEPVEIKSIDSFIDEDDELQVGDIKIKPIHTPGHTQGGMSYLIGDKLFTGDTMFKGSVGRCDLQGGNIKAIEKSIKEKLFTYPKETETYPGHGPSSTIGYEKNYNEILNL